jgi:hypothetical protein
MTTTASIAPSFQLTVAADVMDFQPDSGQDFDDGDIDLELGSPHRVDDDVVLNDAGLDIQTTSGDQDDFMADNEDLIDEDIINYDDFPGDEHSTNNGELAQRDTTNDEEDLIDYSDDEEEPPSAVSSAFPNKPAALEKVEVKEQPVISASSPAAEIAPDEEFSYEYLQETEPGQEITNESVQATQDEPGPDGVSQVDGDDDQKISHDTKDELFADAEADSSDPQPKENNDSDTLLPSHDQDPSELLNDETVVNETTDQSHSPVQSHQITINYDGAELWLFKQHDYENSGDFLIEESHLVPEGALSNKPISSVLEACRKALGSDITDDLELGFRLDNFRNIELYQDHSACAFLTLEYIVNLYLQLHAQDGICDPESFYMTLIARPRVSALFNVLNEAAAKGSGHVGLNKDIAAGLTSFNAQLTHGSTGYEDWQDDEQAQKLESHGDKGVDEFEEEYSKTDHEDYKEDAGDEQNEEQDEGTHEQQYKADDTVVAPQLEVQSPQNAGLTETANDFLEAEDNSIPQEAEHSPHRTSQRQTPVLDAPNSQTQEEEDELIDYSEDEDDVADPPKAQPQNPLPSSSRASSTVQGDDISHVHDSTNHDYFDNEGEAILEVEEDFTQYDNVEGGFHEQYEGEYFEENDEALEQEYNATELLAESSAGFCQATNDETTNYNDEYEDQFLDDDFGLAGGVDDGNDQGPLNRIDGDFSGTDAFLDFEGADGLGLEFTNDQAGGSVENDDTTNDNEDGVDGQTPVAASTAAEPLAISSSGPLELSPQGQKRTIDEVGNDVGEAIDSSGMSFWKCRKLCPHTD